ncbi:hypothetical protein B296_00000868 [Ensete ventricosum]|uniref:Uncharacterized protein n=1 Tax=Ensete ventricosum TaxID=4639 RepID=A0A426Y483_ENSVE|nr:hypothetical protein B296_00000868 [Ensete ventricosum]
MFLLRFCNSGIKAKVVRAKDCFRLRVMRLNRVELFYAFLLHFHSKGSEERGWQVMARASIGVVDYGQDLYRGGPTRSGPLARATKGQHLPAVKP